MSNVLKVGITGGIGVGKSVAIRLFSMMGIPVYDADSRAKFLMVNDSVIVKELTEVFGEDTFVNGELNRRYLAQKLVADKSAAEKLNSIVHPRVGVDFDNWCIQQSNVPFVLKEAALLIESGAHKQLDKLIVVSAPKDIRIQRVLQRDSQRSVEEIEGIMARQLPENDKIKMADWVIVNDGVEPIIPQVWDLYHQLRN